MEGEADVAVRLIEIKVGRSCLISCSLRVVRIVDQASGSGWECEPSSSCSLKLKSPAIARK